MRQRAEAGKPAAITFTRDFHELVTGDLRPGGTLLLRYDPERIVPATDGYRFGDPDRPIIAHLQFAANAPSSLDIPLHSPAGIIQCPDVDLTGQGSMLAATLTVPTDAERVILWFSYARGGSLLYDSDYGANYRFGFACREIAIVEAAVDTPPAAGVSQFDLVVRAAFAVERVTVHYTLVADPTCAEYEFELQRTGQDEVPSDAVLWAGSSEVPQQGIVRFRLLYWIGGSRFTDDNSGAWYLVPEPMRDDTPPPSPALLEAASTWA